MPAKPFPRTELEIGLLLRHWVENLTTYSVTLGIPPAMLTQLEEDSANFDYLVDFSNSLHSFKESFQDFKDSLFDDATEWSPEAPGFNSVSMPGPYKTGIIPRAKALAKFIKASPGYTEQIGEALDLVVDNPNHVQPSEIVPELKLTALNTGNVEIKFSKQGMDAIKIFWRTKGEQHWQDVGIFTSSPTVHVVSYSVPESKQPVALEYRAILLKKNQPVTQYSPVYSIVTTPDGD